MRSQMKFVRHGKEIALVSRNGGKALAVLLLLEVVLLGAIIAHLAAVLPNISALVAPIAVSLALIAWTASQIKPDYRITLDLAAREGRIVRIAPLTGSHTQASFPLDDLESLTLQQTAGQAARKSSLREYIIAADLRGGARHVLSARGPFLAYQDNINRFSRAAGIATRIVRLPDAG